MLAPGFNFEEAETHRAAATQILLSLNNRLKKFATKREPLFLVDAKETLADWAIWPFVRQFRIADITTFDKNQDLKYLRIWLDYFLSHPSYQMVMKKT